MADQIEILVLLKRVAEFVSNTQQASKAVEGVGTSTEKAGKQAKVSWKSVAKWGGAATVVYGAQKFIRGAVSATEDLGKSTLALNRTTGMDIKTSGQWATVLKERGIQTKSFQMGMVKLSREMEKTRKGTAAADSIVTQLGHAMDTVRKVGGKDAPAALEKLQGQMDRAVAKGEKSREMWKRLGVSMDTIKRGNTQQVLLQVSDAFAKMRNPAERAALTQQLFSRTGQQLAPILYKGSDAIREQLGTAGRYVNFNAKNAKQLKQLIAQQRELKTAYLGVQVSLGTALLPLMTSFSGLIVDISRFLSPLTKNTWLFKAAIFGLVAAFTAYKVTMIVSTIAQTAFNVSLGVTEVLLTGGIVLAIFAVIAAIYLLIKHWDKVKLAAQFVWNWIKKNWPLLVAILLGPFAVAVYTIAKHWQQIKQGAAAAVTWIKAKFDQLIDYFRNLPGRIGNWFKNIPGVGLLGRARGGIGGALGGAAGALPFQHGGSVTSRAAALVGERGPEVVSLPAGATVAPLTRQATLAMAGVGGAQTIVTKVYLDRRQIAEAVGTYTADKLARR